MSFVAPRPGFEPRPGIRLLRELGSGGMGALWIATHEALGSEVVVKFVAEHLASDAVARERFSREAMATSRVKSPHVVQMLDHGVSPTGVPFLVMELLEGRDLATRLDADGRLEPAELAAILRQVAKALAKAHAVGIVHRDVKPSNIFLCDNGGDVFVKLLDFGIAKWRAPESAVLTGSNTSIGTPHYMSPEQLLGEADLDARSDVWALGVVAFEALTGQRPFNGQSAAAIVLAVHNAPLPSARAANPALPEALDEWFARACAKSRDARFPSAVNAVAALAVALDVPWAPLESEPPGRSKSDSPAAFAPTQEANIALDDEPMTASLPRGFEEKTPPAVDPPRRSRPRRTALLASAGAILIAIAGFTLWRATRPTSVPSAEPVRPLGPSLCTREGWCWQSPSPAGNALNAIWGTGPNDFWIVGDHGTILHADGEHFEPTESGTTKNLHGIWGRAADDAWAVGDSGTVLHFDGRNWSSQPALAAKGADSFYSIAAHAAWPRFPIAVGDHGAIIQFTGTEWGTPFWEMPLSSQENPVDFRGIWAAPGGQVLAVGKQNTLAMYFVEEPSDAGAPIGRWASATASIAKPRITSFRGIWGTSSDDFWVIGPDAAVAHGDLARMDVLRTPAGARVDYHAIWGRSAKDVWLVGQRGEVRHWTGRSWDLDVHSWQVDLNAVWGAREGETWVVGQYGTILVKTSTGWDEKSKGFHDNLSGVWVASPKRVFTASRTESEGLRYDGAAWGKLADPTGGGSRAFFGVEGKPVRGVGRSNRIVRFEANGETILEYSEETGPADQLQAIWGAAEDDLWAVGTSGAIVHYDGKRWARDRSPTTENLRAVWGTLAPRAVWAFGANHTVLRRRSGAWEVVNAIQGEIYGAWGLGNDIWAVGDEGRVWRISGDSVAEETRGPTGSLRAVWGRSAKEIYVVGLQGASFRYDGSRWLPQDIGTSNDLYGVGGTNTEVWLTGAGGTILHRSL